MSSLSPLPSPSFKPSPSPACRKCGGTGIVTVYDKILDFNPNSSPQVARLIRHFGLKMPVKRGSGGDETTEAKYLKRFARKGVQKCSCVKRNHPPDPSCPKCEGKGVFDFGIFSRMLDYRKRTKMVGTYIWPTSSDDKVHTTYGFVPSTWRKSSKDVNLQNIPIRDKELADAMRETIIASPGCLLVQADAESIEAVITGYCAGDDDYIRVAKAGLHGFVASWRVASTHGGKGIDPALPFGELRKACQAIKHDPAYHKEYDDSKRGSYGTNYLLSAYGMWDEYQETFPTQAKAQEFIDFYHGLFPRIRPWQQTTVERAHKETYLDNHYQYRHYFYDVFSFNYRKFKKLLAAGIAEPVARKEAWELGEDGKRAVAFVPQSDASACQTEDLLEIAATPAGEFLRMITHDSFTLDVPKDDVAGVVNLVSGIMSRPRPELGGLTIGVELKVGQNLNALEVVE